MSAKSWVISMFYISDIIENTQLACRDNFLKLDSELKDRWKKEYFYL